MKGKEFLQQSLRFAGIGAKIATGVGPMPSSLTVNGFIMPHRNFSISFQDAELKFKTHLLNSFLQQNAAMDNSMKKMQALLQQPENGARTKLEVKIDSKVEVDISKDEMVIQETIDFEGKIEAQKENEAQEAQEGLETNANVPSLVCYSEKIQAVFRVYKEFMRDATVADIAALANKNQEDGNYKMDDLKVCTLDEVGKGKSIPLLNVVVDAGKNINALLLLHLIKDIFEHKADAKGFIEMLRTVMPERLAAELESLKVAPELINSLINEPLDADAQKTWEDLASKANVPLAHSQWCSLASGIKSGKIEDYYLYLQIEPHKTRGRKSDLAIILVPTHLQELITVAYGKANANQQYGIGGHEQVYLHRTDMLFLLHYSNTVRVIKQNDNHIDPKSGEKQPLYDRVKYLRTDHFTGDFTGTFFNTSKKDVTGGETLDVHIGFSPKKD